MVEARRNRGAEQWQNGIFSCIFQGDPDRNRVDVSGNDPASFMQGSGDRQHTGSASYVQHPAWPEILQNIRQGDQASKRCAVMTGAESLSGIDFDVVATRPAGIAVMAAVQKKTAGGNRVKGCLRLCDPVSVGKFLERDSRGRYAKNRSRPADFVLYALQIGQRFTIRIDGPLIGLILPFANNRLVIKSGTQGIGKGSGVSF